MNLLCNFFSCKLGSTSFSREDIWCFSSLISWIGGSQTPASISRMLILLPINIIKTHIPIKKRSDDEVKVIVENLGYYCLSFLFILCQEQICQGMLACDHTAVRSLPHLWPSCRRGCTLCPTFACCVGSFGCSLSLWCIHTSSECLCKLSLVSKISAPLEWIRLVVSSVGMALSKRKWLHYAYFAST